MPHFLSSVGQAQRPRRGPNSHILGYHILGGSPKGIDMDLVVSDVGRTYFTCSICTDLIANMVMVKNCEHLYCRDCINHAIRTQNSVCPECRTPITACHLQEPGRVLRKMLNEVQIKCKFRPCDQIILYENYG